MCLFCENKELLDFYKDKQDILYKFMDIFSEKTRYNAIPNILSEKMSVILSSFSENLKHNISSSSILSQEIIKNTINSGLKELEYSIETKSLKNKFTPSLKGACSEEELYLSLSKEISDEWEITKTNTSGSKKGDIFLENDYSKIIIDLKDYSSNIPSSQVEKIKRDMALHGSHGFLVSINTNISKHKDYTFELVGNKILAYISKGDILSKIKSWANLILCLEKVMNSNYSKDLSISKTDIEYIASVCRDYDSKISSFKEFLENNIKNSRNELNKISSQKNEDIFLFLNSKIKKIE